MKITIYVFTFLLFSTQVHAQTHQCETELLDFKLQQHSIELSGECRAYTEARAKQVSKYQDDSIELYGYKNIIIIKKFDSKKQLVSSDLIGGVQSRLKNIISLNFSKSLNRVFVLDNKEKAVLSFDLNIVGNIAPKRKLYSDFVGLSSHFVISNSGENLYVLNSLEREVRVFLAKADVDNRAPAHDINSIKTIALPGSISLNPSLTIEDGSLFVQDQNGLKLLLE